MSTGEGGYPYMPGLGNPGGGIGGQSYSPEESHYAVLVHLGSGSGRRPPWEMSEADVDFGTLNHATIPSMNMQQ